MLSLSIVCGAVLAGYFSIGRIACPSSDRLPLSELGFADVCATIRRGWYTLGQYSRLETMSMRMRRDPR